jgi:DHA2 family multidrug resistance protein
VIWESRHDNPVVEITLLRERNFALANAFYFVFGFVLFGSTVLIPQMLQSLYGYSAQDAGLVLGPGAMVIVVLAPLVVRVFPKLGARVMIGSGYVVIGLAMWLFASFTLQADYRHEALARALQGLGIAPLIVPITGLAYSFLPRNKNNKASSLTNLFRNLGGSFGIAFVTTMLERRSQFHQAVLVSHATPFDAGFQGLLDRLTATFIAGGDSAADAAVRAQAQAYHLIQRQAAMLGFLDCFYVLGWVAILSSLLVLLIRPFSAGGGGAAH